MAYTKYSLTPADNNAAPPNGAPEGMLPSAVNDTMRDMMAQIRDVGDGIRGGTYTMTAPVITGGSITGVALSGNTFTSPVITGGSINNTPIGASTANTGAFTTLGATGVATFSAGTVSAPAITTTGDTNTGIFFPAADTIAFTEGGAESMRITSIGNVGIGGTPLTDTRLLISNGGAVGMEFSPNIAIANENRLLSFNRGTSAYAPMNYDASTHQFLTSSSERMRITSSGQFLLGKTVAGTTDLGFEYRPNDGIYSTLSASTNAGGNTYTVYSTGANDFRFYVGMGGTVFATSTTISAISDVRLKENIQDIDVGLDAVMALKPRKFDWKEGKGKNTKGDRGWIAQEFEQVFPEMIQQWKQPAPEGEEPYKSVGADLIPVLVKAIQEQQTLIENLTTRLTALEGK